MKPALRKVLCLLLSASILLVLPVFALGAASAPADASPMLAKCTVLFLGSSDAYINGNKTKVDANNDQVMPRVVEGRTLVPARFVAESTGAAVGWDDATQTVSIDGNGKAIKLVLNSNIMLVNNDKIVLDTAAQTINDRTMVPLRALVEALGKKVFWDDRGLILLGDEEIDKEKNKDEINQIIGLFIKTEDTADAGVTKTDPVDPSKIIVTASTYENSNVGVFPPENTLDKDFTAKSSWRAEGMGVWIQYDLGASKQINSVDIAFFSGHQRKYTFDILVSDNGTDWTTIKQDITNSGTSDKLETYEVNAKGRYLRIVGKGNNNEKFPLWTNILEVEMK